ncbi:MAG: sortase [Thermoleophilaceae bacterium]|nr:sortase [Thermoleophilaceae bacterium]
MRAPPETGASVFPEEDLRDELVTSGEPLIMKLADLLDRFDVKPSDRAAVAEIEEWFEELGMAAEPTLLETEGRKRKLTLYMREWGPPANGASPEPVAVERPSDEGSGLAAQLAAETGMPLAAAADVIGQFDPGSDFVAGLRERASEAAPEPAVEPADSVAEPAPAAESEDAEQPARPRRRRTLLVASWVMFAAGGLLLLEAGITVVWQEPFSAFYSARAQGRLEDKLERLEDSERARENAEKRRLLAAEKRAERPGKRRISRKRKSEARLTSLADSFSRRVGEGKPLGEISIPKIGMKQVMVQGTKPTTLRQGPGHYTGTTLPGQDGTVGIAGHRSTYSAPFKKLNELKKGDEVFVKLPYGLFTYRIEGTKIISPDNIGAFRRAGYNRLMMTACHPIFSDRQRIIAFGRLEKIEPRGAAVL